MNTLHIYTDGSSCSTTKDAGIGLVFVEDGQIVHEARESIRGTNNYAELFAIQRGLEKTETTSGLCEGFDEVVIYSDSAVSIGKIKREYRNTNQDHQAVLEAIWKAIDAIKARGVKVGIAKADGHSSDLFNNRADALARMARKEGASPKEVTYL